MLNQLVSFDRETKFILACSGGVDSMAIADFYKKGNKNFALAYFNHATPQASSMEEFVRSYADKNKLEFLTATVTRDKLTRESPEEYWRIQRYEWLNSFELPIVTCHHLNDCIETWLFSCLHGNPKVIAIKNGNIYRPFLSNSKQELIDWCTRNNVSWVEDKSNKDIKYPRNRIRHNIIPEALEINPGLSKVIKKKILQQKLEMNLK